MTTTTLLHVEASSLSEGTPMSRPPGTARKLCAPRASPSTSSLRDVMMPKVDGVSVLACPQDRRGLRDLPGIMILGAHRDNSMARCIELGAVDYSCSGPSTDLLKARSGDPSKRNVYGTRSSATRPGWQEELDAARRLSMAMLPQSFPAPSHGFSDRSVREHEPAREVCGDLYDFFVTEDEFWFPVVTCRARACRGSFHGSTQ